MSSNAPLDDLVAYLPTIFSSPILTFGVNFHAGILPDQPDASIAIIEYMAGASDYTMGSGNLATSLPAIEESRFQIVSRDVESNYLVNQATIETLYRAILQAGSPVIAATQYQRIEPIQRPFFLMRDEKRRIYHVVNIMVLRTPN